MFASESFSDKGCCGLQAVSWIGVLYCACELVSRFTLVGYPVHTCLILIWEFPI